jgi:hypothetical protein
MKSKIWFGVIGCGLFIGTIVLLIKKMNKNSYDIIDNNKDNNENSFSVSSETESERKFVNVDDAKIHFAGSVYNRHKQAAEVIKETMENINKNSEVHNNHKEEFDSMMDDLNMLSE